MKKSSLILKALLIGVGSLYLLSCTKTAPSNSSGDNSQTTSETSDPYPGDENWVDYVFDGTVSLDLEYANHDFYTDGIGQFTLKTAIDGDTAHFTPAVDSTGQGTMKARFYGIDTPESTGKVQPYGKAASRFTKEKLYEANEHGTIVVSSAQTGYGKPQPDSTGSRYVSLVWVNLTKKNAPKEELVLLNLWIVQEGLSWVKNVQSMPQYSDTFYAAELQARNYKLKLFSDEDDPDMPTGEYQSVSLLEIKEEVGKCMADSTHQNAFDNTKLRIQGAVAGFSNHILYLQDFYFYDDAQPELGGEYCGINIFCGMGEVPSKYTKRNAYIEICGLAQQTENYGFQVTDVHAFPTGSPLSDDDSKVILKPEENEGSEHSLYVFQYTNAQLSAVAQATDPYNLECLNCYVQITETLEVERVYISESTSKEVTLYFKNSKFNVFIPFNYKGDPNRPNYRWVLEEDFLGEKFNVTGVYVHHKTANGKNTFQIVPNNKEDLVWVPTESNNGN